MQAFDLGGWYKIYKYDYFVLYKESLSKRLFQVLCIYCVNFIILLLAPCEIKIDVLVLTE